MTDSSDRLLAALAAIDRGTTTSSASSARLCERSQLDLLLAASDEDAGAAVVERAWVRETVLPGVWSTCSPAEQARVSGWVLHSLQHFLAVRGTTAELHPLLDRIRPFVSPAMVPSLGECLRRRTLHQRASELLALVGTPEAWALLRQHDSAEIRLAIRLDAALHDPARPRPGLAALLGPGTDRGVRKKAAEEILHSSKLPPLEPDLLGLLLGCFEDSIMVRLTLMTLPRHADPAMRRIFDRLWPFAKSRRPRPWSDVTNEVFYRALVQTAPAPDLLAILLDESADVLAASALVEAIGNRPDPHLVPALTRWSKAHPDRKDQALVKPALAACRRARPW